MTQSGLNKTALARYSGQFRTGFTITELLVVVAIMAILLTILLSVLDLSATKMHQTQCVSNLRHIGTAILTYANDHGGRLPGPGPGGIAAGYQKSNFSSPAHLSHHLLPYMEAPTPAGDKEILLLSAFVCPASMPYLNASDQQWGKTYSQVPSRYKGVPNITDANGAMVYPFGYKAGNDPDAWHDAPLLAEINYPSRTFAVLDRRNLAPGVDSGHRDYRNVLFLDGHVRSIPLSDFISISELR